MVENGQEEAGGGQWNWQINRHKTSTVFKNMLFTGGIKLQFCICSRILAAGRILLFDKCKVAHPSGTRSPDICHVSYVGKGEHMDTRIARCTESAGQFSSPCCCQLLIKRCRNCVTYFTHLHCDI